MLFLDQQARMICFVLSRFNMEHGTFGKEGR